MLNFQDALSVVSGLANNTLPLPLAEMEAKQVWERYHQRKTIRLFEEAAEALKQNPKQARSIADNVASSLCDLQCDVAGDGRNLTYPPTR